MLERDAPTKFRIAKRCNVWRLSVLVSKEYRDAIQRDLDYIPNTLFEIAHRFLIIAAIAAGYDLTKLFVLQMASFTLSGMLFWPILSRLLPYPPEKSSMLGWSRYITSFALSVAAGGILNYYTTQLVAIMVKAHFRCE